MLVGSDPVRMVSSTLGDLTRPLLHLPNPHDPLQATRGRLNMLEAGRGLVAKKGIMSLYSGLGVTLVGSIPAVAVYFGVYQYSKKALG